MTSADGSTLQDCTVNGNNVEEITVDGNIAWLRTKVYTSGQSTYQVGETTSQLKITVRGESGNDGGDLANQYDGGAGGNAGEVVGTLNVSGGETFTIDAGATYQGGAGGDGESSPESNVLTAGDGGDGGDAYIVERDADTALIAVGEGGGGGGGAGDVEDEDNTQGGGGGGGARGGAGGSAPGAEGGESGDGSGNGGNGGDGNAGPGDPGTDGGTVAHSDLNVISTGTIDSAGKIIIEPLNYR